MTTKTFELNETLLQNLYKSASGGDKAILEEKFGKDILCQSIINRTPTVEAALAIAGKTIAGLTRSTDSKHETACRIIEAVIEILNDGEKVDYSNSDQTKYEPRFYHTPGLGLSYDVYVYWATSTICGPRLCYLKYDVMLHGIKILDTYYNDYLNSKK